MNEPYQLDTSNIFEFIAGPAPAVLFLSLMPSHPFNRQVCECFGEDTDAAVTFGQLPMMDLLDIGSPAFAFFRSEIQYRRIPVPVAVPPGYYLFIEGRMLAWESGLPSSNDAERIIRGSILGAAVSLLTRNWRFVTSAIRSASEQATAERIADHFRGAAEAHSDNPQGASARTTFMDDELANAYRVLQIKPTASDTEVDQAWQRLQRRYHPDRAGQSDQEEFTRLNKQSAEINRARDIIRDHRRYYRKQRATGTEA